MSLADFVVNWLAFTPVFATPLVLAALGLIICERAGVLNLGAEGFMLCGALAGVAAYLSLGQSPWLGMVAAMLAAVLVSLLFGFMAVLLRANQVVAGVSIVFFCYGLTGLLGTAGGWTNRAVGGFAKLDLGPLTRLPVVGRILFGQDPIVYLTVIAILLVHRVLFASAIGMKLRAVGENPQAADAAGIGVTASRMLAVIAGAALMGAAGGYLSLASSKIWIDHMTGGRGWIAIAVVIFSRWRPGRALVGALLFGSIEALIPRISAAGLQVPQYFLLMTPYVATLAVMIWTGLRGRGGLEQPGALGLPYVREDRR
jgi:simple sugar transport system permease protein